MTVRENDASYPVSPSCPTCLYHTSIATRPTHRLMGSLAQHRRRWPGIAKPDRRTGRDRRRIAQSVGVTPPFREPDWLHSRFGGVGALFQECTEKPDMQEPPLTGTLKWPSTGSSTASVSSSNNDRVIDGNGRASPRWISFNQAVEVSQTIVLCLQGGESCCWPLVALLRILR